MFKTLQIHCSIKSIIKLLYLDFQNDLNVIKLFQTSENTNLDHCQKIQNILPNLT